MAARDIAYFARTNFRHRHQPFGIRLDDRHHHMYVIGKTGTGKSTLLVTLIGHDLKANHGLAVFDPHGDLADAVVRSLPPERQSDLIYLNLPDPACPLRFNPLQQVPTAARARAASGLLESFKKLWLDSWGPRLEHLLRNALQTLVEQPEATFADIPRLLLDREFRRQAANRVANQHVRHFWLREYEGYPERLRGEAIAPLQNKVGAFLSNPVATRVVCAPQSSFSIEEVMNQGKILVVNLAKGLVGEDTASLLGSFLVSRIGTEAMGRASFPASQRRSFFVYLDEFQSITTQSLVTMLSELRKYRVGLVLANQYLAQLDPAVQEAILGNVGTIVAFRVGVSDAEILGKEFYPDFTESDLVNLPNYHIYLRLMIDGRVSRPFSAETLWPR